MMGGGLLNPQEPPAATVYLDGSFEFSRVLPGSYTIRAMTPVFANNNSVVTINGALAPLTSAQPMPVQQTQVSVTPAGATNVRVEAPHSQGASIAGAIGGSRLLGRVSGRAAWTGPAAVALSGGGLAEDLITPLFWDGSFEFPGVPNGTYTVTLRPPVPGAIPAKVTVTGSADVKSGAACS
jgi:hypothetical protein